MFFASSFKSVILDDSFTYIIELSSPSSPQIINRVFGHVQKLEKRIMKVSNISLLETF